jgi:hypothetical protein
VHDVIGLLQNGETVGSLVGGCLPLTKAQVYKCLAYYEDHRGEIDLLVAPDGGRAAVKFLLDHDVPEDVTYLLQEPGHEILRLRLSRLPASCRQAAYVGAGGHFWFTGLERALPSFSHMDQRLPSLRSHERGFARPGFDAS